MTDIGYGMRIFLFGSIVGIVSSLILGRKDTTVDHPYYMSVYSSRSLGLVGLVVAVCTFPMLVVGSLYKTSINYSYILFIATLNMYLAVGAGILGAFSASAIFNGKIFLHDLVFSGLAVIIYIFRVVLLILQVLIFTETLPFLLPLDSFFPL